MTRRSSFRSIKSKSCLVSEAYCIWKHGSRFFYCKKVETRISPFKKVRSWSNAILRKCIVTLTCWQVLVTVHWCGPEFSPCEFSNLKIHFLSMSSESGMRVACFFALNLVYFANTALSAWLVSASVHGSFWFHVSCICIKTNFVFGKNTEWYFKR